MNILHISIYISKLQNKHNRHWNHIPCEITFFILLELHGLNTEYHVLSYMTYILNSQSGAVRFRYIHRWSNELG